MKLDMNRYPSGDPVDQLGSCMILPIQYFTRPCELRPESQLMAAVLDDAVQCVERYRFSADATSRRLFNDAKQWMLTADPHWPYSFERLCEVFDLDANAIRQRLQLARQPPQKQGHKRRTSPKTDTPRCRA